MTRQWMIALWFSGVCAVAWSQGDLGQAGGAAQAERARIESLREKKTNELDAEDAACLSRFAVTDCQNRVGVRRRQMLFEFKAQEAVRNVAERRQKGEDQLKKQGQVKLGENRQWQLEAQAAAEKLGLEDRQQAQSDKQRAHQRQAQPMGSKLVIVKSGLGMDAKTVEKNREAYLEKQKALEKRRKERDQRLLDHGKGGPSLPLTL